MGGRKIGEISFFLLETNETTFFREEGNRKMSNFKIQGGKVPFVLPSDARDLEQPMQ